MEVINFAEGMTPEVDDLALGLMSKLLAAWNGGMGEVGVPLCGAAVEEGVQLSPGGRAYIVRLDLREAE